MRALPILLACAIAAPVSAQVDETITVVRYLLEVRVTDSRGKPISDLTASDFSVEVGGKAAVVESAEWTGRPKSDTQPVANERRWVIFLVQTDFARNAPRIKGQMRFNSVADDFVAALNDNDRVAVVSHDSHVKLRLDFTSDKSAIRDALQRAIFIDDPPPPPAAADGPSLVRLLSAGAMRDAVRGESALLLVTNALHAIEGRRLLVVAGWGLGQRSTGHILLQADWDKSIAQLQQDHIPVITIGTGLGGELTRGLVATSESTGGIHVNPQASPQQATARFAGAVAGVYDLSLRIDDPLPPGRHELKVTVKRPGARVAAPSSVVNAR